MPRFSERNGFKKARDVLQKDSIDAALRIGIWNWLFNLHFVNVDNNIINWRGHLDGSRLLALRLWVGFLKLPMDELDQFGGYINNKIK